jgi:hypothetical protein
MYALASKGFGKKAVDLNKKDFYDASASTKYTAKGKTSTGVEWEANQSSGVDKKGADKNSQTMKVTIPVDGKIKVACELDGVAKSTLTVNVDLGSGLDWEGAFSNPDINDLKGALGGLENKLNYKTADFSVEGAFKVDPAGGMGAAAAIAMDMPGLDGFKVALKPAMTTGADASKTVDVMLGYDAKDFSIAALGGYASAGEKAAKNVSLRAFFKASGDLNLAAEYDSTGFKGGKPGYGKVEFKDSTAFKIGAEYKINSSTTAKYKFDAGNKTGQYCIKCALDSGNVILSNSGSDWGMVYTLEA